MPWILLFTSCFNIQIAFSLYTLKVACNVYNIYVAIGFLGLAGSGYLSVMLQFTLDQLVGTSGVQLKFVIYRLNLLSPKDYRCVFPNKHLFARQ